MSSPMHPLVQGRLFYARRDRFSKPGIHLWAFGRHWRVLPIPRADVFRDIDRLERELRKLDEERGTTEPPWATEEQGP